MLKRDIMTLGYVLWVLLTVELNDKKMKHILTKALARISTFCEIKKGS